MGLRKGFGDVAVTDTQTRGTVAKFGKSFFECDLVFGSTRRARARVNDGWLWLCCIAS